jgi:sulfatase modifying factor 1
LNGGQGLANSGSGGGYETGWVAADNANIAPTNANLSCSVSYGTWTSTPGTQENLPVDCVNLAESYAFCIWDGGFLPSEAEWEYAAVGGAEQREYPWGSTPPGMTDQFAIFGDNMGTCYYPGGPSHCVGIVNIAPVGSAPMGAGRWGQLDLAGEMWVRTLDWFAPYAPCIDCASLTAATARVIRGGDFGGPEPTLLPQGRSHADPGARTDDISIRCARTP